MAAKNKPKTVINTRWQDATNCISCGADTSKTLGYCQSCGGKGKQKNA